MREFPMSQPKKIRGAINSSDSLVGHPRIERGTY